MLPNTGKLAGLTCFITGASRGIGKAIALKIAKDGANIVIAAKTAQPHPKLPGTIYTAAQEIEAAGGKALPCIVDVRNEEEVKAAVENAVKTFGGIDIVVNNASAISLTGTVQTSMKKYDLMHDINSRGTYLVSKYCIPHLMKSSNPHILNMSPPLNMNPMWFSKNLAYTMSKYGMSMCALGMAEELREHGIACNTLWPRTAIITAAITMIGGTDMNDQCRKPEIMADAAYALLTRNSRSCTGKFAVDEDILREEGIQNFDSYAVTPGHRLMPDFFLDDVESELQGSAEVAAQKSGPQPTPAGSLAVAQIFERIENLLSEDLVKNVNAVYDFEMTGDPAEKWFLDLKHGRGSCGRGNSPEKADAVLTMSSENFALMFSGSLSTASAFMSRKLKISGDLGKAIKLESLMQKLHSKL